MANWIEQVTAKVKSVLQSFSDQLVPSWPRSFQQSIFIQKISFNKSTIFFQPDQKHSIEIPHLPFFFQLFLHLAFGMLYSPNSIPWLVVLKNALGVGKSVNGWVTAVPFTTKNNDFPTVAFRRSEKDILVGSFPPSIFTLVTLHRNTFSSISRAHKRELDIVTEKFFDPQVVRSVQDPPK